MKHYLRELAVCVSSLILLTACGGGGGGGGGGLPLTAGPVTTASAEQAPSAPAAEQPAAPVVTAPEAVPETPADPQQPAPQVPVAKLPSKVDTLIQTSVQVDGSTSTGVPGKSISYLWSIESKPVTSTTQLFTATNPSAMFWADVVGTYKLKLVVSSDGKTSDPAYTTVEAIAPGALAPFATFKASGLNTFDSASVGGCSYFRSPANFSNFWDFANLTDLNCLYATPAGAPDLERRGSNSGGTLSAVAMNVRYLDSTGMSGKSQVTWANVNTISSYGYALSAEPTELAKIPAGKVTGSDFHHGMTAASVMQGATGGVLQYRIEGTMTPANVAPGWDLDQTLTVVVTLEGQTFINSQPGYESIKVFERTFTADFNETIPLSLNWAQMPATFVNSGSYRVAVWNRVAFKRTSE